VNSVSQYHCALERQARLGAIPVDEVVNGVVVRALPTHGPPSSASTSRARMMIEMDRVPPQPVKDPPNLIRTGVFSLDRLLSHIDPGTEEESEEFVRRIYERRHVDLSSDRNGRTGR
jgi:hypothetical protein